MLATLITDDNKDVFLKDFQDKIIEKCGLVIGVKEEESDTACGVLACEIFQEKNIIMRHIYVDKKYRGRGAGRAMISFLLDYAKNAGIMSIFARVILLNEEGDVKAVRVLLNNCGFDEMSLGRIFSMRLSDIKQEKRKKGPLILPLGTVGEKEWEKLINLDAYTENREEYSSDYSILSFDRKKDCDGAVLVKNIGDIPMIDQIITGKDDGTDMKKALIDCAIDEIKIKFRGGDKIYVFIGDKSLEETFYDYTDGMLKLEGEFCIEYIDMV